MLMRFSKSVANYHRNVNCAVRAHFCRYEPPSIVRSKHGDVMECSCARGGEGKVVKPCDLGTPTGWPTMIFLTGEPSISEAAVNPESFVP
jgi:hypothetical protein